MSDETPKTRVAVLISGRGSNMVSLADAAKPETYPAEIVCVLSDKSDAGGLQTASEMSIASKAIARSDFASKATHEAALMDELEKYQPDVICLAGYMRILSPEFVSRYERRILNIHPSLLPKYKGLNTHKRALEAGDAEHGCTVHFVTAGLDDGPVVLQAVVPIAENDTEETLAAKVLIEEHRIYPEALAMVASGAVKFSTAECQQKTATGD